MTPMLYIRRDVLKLSQVEMAEIAGVSQSTVSRWESGVAPSLGELALIRAEALRRKVEWRDSMFFEPPPDASPEDAAA
jgi:transcriptional regulator with XRE-family HTH domain